MAGALLGGLLAVRQSGKAARRQKFLQEINEAQSEQWRQINEADSELAAMDGSDIHHEFRKWVRLNYSEGR